MTLDTRSIISLKTVNHANLGDSNYSKCSFELFLSLFVVKRKLMFGIFKKKTEKEKLEEQYRKLLSEAHQLSHTNRKAADEKLAEAEEIVNKIKLIDPQ